VEGKKLDFAKSGDLAAHLKEDARVAHGIFTLVKNYVPMEKVGASNTFFFTVYSATLAHQPVLLFRKSAAATKIPVETPTGEYLGGMYFQGVNTTPAWAYGAFIRVLQNGAAGAYVPADIRFNTYDASATHVALCLTTSGGVHIGGTSDIADNCLYVDNTITAAGGFGCNSKAAQTAYASGGAAPSGGTGATAGAYDTAAHRDALITLVNNIRAALVANGIMS